MRTDNTHDDMSTLLSCLAKARKEGYSLDYTITPEGLCNMKNDRCYSPEEVVIENFYRFEGATDPAESAILYLIKTTDDKKGTLTDAYGAYADPIVTAFIEQVQTFEKK